MASSGITRKVDALGRVVLPAEMRRALGIAEGDMVEFAVDGDHIVVGRAGRRCVFCDAGGELVEFSSRLVCEGCRAALTTGAIGSDA